MKGALHNLTPYLAKGIPEIELPSVEPFRMDELSLSLTTGPNGYKVSLLDIDIFGASNFSVRKIRWVFTCKLYFQRFRKNLSSENWTQLISHHPIIFELQNVVKVNFMC